jgi:hypothetical protein
MNTGATLFISRASSVWKRFLFWMDMVAIVRLNGLLLAGVIVVSAAFLARNTEEMSTFFDKVTFYNALAVLLALVVLFYMIVIVIPYLWFFLTYYVLRRNRNQILFKFPRESCVIGQEFQIDAILQRKMRLLFGAIKFKLVFFNYDTTDWYFLFGNQVRKGQLFNSTDRGAIVSFSLVFRHHGRFRTRYSVVKFEDPFGLLSLPIIEREYHEFDREKNFYMYSLPVSQPGTLAPYYVKKKSVPSVSEQTFRIAEDFFDTKRYEPTDDSRRILWPVFGRMRQLLVRIPERDSVIDADVDVYVLFHNAFFTRDNEWFHARYDDYIRDIMRFLEMLLRQRALSVTLFTDDVPDPPYEHDPHLTSEENIKRQLVSSFWHQDKPPSAFLAQALARRAPDRERILIANPFVSPDQLAPEIVQRFSNAVLLGTGVFNNDAAAGQRTWSVLYRPEKNMLRSLLAASISKPARRRIAMNRLQLGKSLKEIL